MYAPPVGHVFAFPSAIARARCSAILSNRAANWARASSAVWLVPRPACGRTLEQGFRRGHHGRVVAAVERTA